MLWESSCHDLLQSRSERGKPLSVPAPATSYLCHGLMATWLSVKRDKKAITTSSENCRQTFTNCQFFVHSSLATQTGASLPVCLLIYSRLQGSCRFHSVALHVKQLNFCTKAATGYRRRRLFAFFLSP